MAALALTQMLEPCQQGPIKFEQLDHAYGYVLYSTTLAKVGILLSTPHIVDYGYVFVNNVYQVMIYVAIFIFCI